MSTINLTDFQRAARTSLEKSVKKYGMEQRLEINKKLLGKFLIENVPCFERYLVQSEETMLYRAGRGHYYYVLPEIGYVSGKRLFFTIVNKDLNAVNIEGEKPGTSTSPPTITPLELTNGLCYEIVDYLSSKDIGDRNRSSLIVVPAGFYVFEFKAKSSRSRGKEETFTVQPFKARNIDEALKIFSLCPYYYDCSYMRSFRVCTDKGWQSLSSKFRNIWNDPSSARISDYVLSLV